MDGGPADTVVDGLFFTNLDSTLVQALEPITSAITEVGTAAGLEISASLLKPLRSFGKHMRFIPRSPSMAVELSG